MLRDTSIYSMSYPSLCISSTRVSWNVWHTMTWWFRLFPLEMRISIPENLLKTDLQGLELTCTYTSSTLALVGHSIGNWPDGIIH